MRRAERFIHSMPPLGHGDDAHQHRIEDGACALGLQRHLALARAAAFVDVDIGCRSHRRRGRPRRPGAPPPAPSSRLPSRRRMLAFTAEAAVLAQAWR
jgi:hypothetical protein